MLWSGWAWTTSSRRGIAVRRIYFARALGMVTIAPAALIAGWCTAQLARIGARVERSTVDRCIPPLRACLSRALIGAPAEAYFPQDRRLSETLKSVVARQLRRPVQVAAAARIDSSRDAERERCGADDVDTKPVVADRLFHVGERIAICWLPHTR